MNKINALFEQYYENFILNEILNFDVNIFIFAYILVVIFIIFLRKFLELVGKKNIFFSSVYTPKIYILFISFTLLISINYTYFLIKTQNKNNVKDAICMHNPKNLDVLMLLDTLRDYKYKSDYNDLSLSEIISIYCDTDDKI